MPLSELPQYCFDCAETPDGSVLFACSTDQSAWPWLTLPPQHPIVIQTQNFWTSVGVGSAMATRDESKWSALTGTDWVLGDQEAGIATNGIFKRSADDENLEFSTELFDADNRLIVRIRGRGVVFRTRDFESWRDRSKAQARVWTADVDRFDYANRDGLSLSSAEPPLIAPLQTLDGKLATRALLTTENGLMPGHPYFSGSGDHVNAPHLAEIARQTACLVCDGKPVRVLSAEMDMHRYIELGTPIDIGIKRDSHSELTLAISQLEKSCATIAMELA